MIRDTTISTQTSSGSGAAIGTTVTLEPIRQHAGVDSIVCQLGETTIGSGADCDAVLDHSGIVEHHCVLTIEPSRVSLKGLSPLTWINDGPARDNTVRNGDIVTLGPLEFRAKVARISVVAPQLQGTPSAEVASIPATQEDETARPVPSKPLFSGADLLDAIAAQISGRLQSPAHPQSPTGYQPSSYKFQPAATRSSLFDTQHRGSGTAAEARAVVDSQLADEQRRLAEQQLKVNEQLAELRAAEQRLAESRIAAELAREQHAAEQAAAEQRLAARLAEAERTASERIAKRLADETARREQLIEIEHKANAQRLELERKESAIALRERELVLARQRFEEQAVHVSRETTDLDSVRSQLESERREVQELTRQLQESQKQWQQMLADLSQEVSSSQSRFAEREELLAEQEQAVSLRSAELEQRETTLAQQVIQAKQRHVDLQRQLVALDSQDRELQAEVSKQQSEREQLQTLQRQLDAAREDLASAQEELERSRAEIAAEKVILDQDRNEIVASAQSLSIQREELTAASAACAEDRTRIDASLRDIESRREQLDRRTVELESLAVDLEQQAESIAVAMQDAEAVRTEEARLADFEAVNSEARLHERESVQRSSADSPEFVDRDETSPAVRQSELAHQQAELVAQQAETEAALEQLKIDRASLDAEQTSLEWNRRELTEMQSQLEMDRAELQVERDSLELRANTLANQATELDLRVQSLQVQEREFAERVALQEQGSNADATGRDESLWAESESTSHVGPSPDRSDSLSQVSELTIEIAHRDAALQALQAEHHEVVAERDRLHEELLSLFDLRTQQALQQSQLDAERESLTNDQTRLAEQAAEMEAQLLQLQSEAASLEAERNAHIADREALIAERQMAITEREVLDVELEELRLERERCRAERIQLIAEEQRVQGLIESRELDLESTEGPESVQDLTVGVDENVEIDESEFVDNNSSGCSTSPAMDLGPGAGLMALLNRDYGANEATETDSNVVAAEQIDTQVAEDEPSEGEENVTQSAASDSSTESRFDRIDEADRDSADDNFESNPGDNPGRQQDASLSRGSEPKSEQSGDPQADELRNRLAALFGIPDTQGRGAGESRHHTDDRESDREHSDVERMISNHDESSDTCDHGSELNSSTEDVESDAVDDSTEDTTTMTYGGDDSIASYMEQLLARTRRTGSVDDAPVVSKKPQAPAVKQHNVDSTSADKELVVAKSEPAPEEVAVRERANENRKESTKRQNESMRENIDSMREIANRSARSAVARHQTRKLSISTQVQLALTGAGAVITVILLTAELWGNSYRWQGIGTLLVTLTAAGALAHNWWKVRSLQKLSEAPLVDDSSASETDTPVHKPVSEKRKASQVDSQLHTLRELAKQKAMGDSEETFAAVPLESTTHRPSEKSENESKAGNRTSGKVKPVTPVSLVEESSQFTLPKIVQQTATSAPSSYDESTDEEEVDPRVRMLAGVADFSMIRDRKLESND